MEYNLQKEKQEALDAGKTALYYLELAKKDLDSASNWGLFDMLGGGGFSTFIKHNKMNKANRNIDAAKHYLESFSRELQDVQINFELNIDVDGFLTFADYFFDNLFVDWMVQDKISTAKDQINQAIYSVNKVIDELNRY